jgi:magnesium-protoporphyrin O-methyltransferase
VQLARERAPADLGAGAVEFRVGDMLDPALGRFDHVVAMDSLIHYRTEDVVRVLSGLAARSRCSILFTFAPRTPALAAMHAVGRLFPRGNRAPAIEPVSEARLQRLLAIEPALLAWQAGRTQRVASGFYTSQALELSSV